MDEPQLFRSVMVIDDDRLMHELFNYLLERGKFAQTIHNYLYAEDALQYLQLTAEKNPADLPQIIFLDSNMPFMNGWEFIEQYSLLNKTYRPDSRLFLLTSSVDPFDIERSKTFEVVEGFISKPISKKILQDIGMKK